MTSLSLLLWITLGIGLQLALYLSIGFWRHWQEYLALRNHTIALNLPAPPRTPVPHAPGTPAWQGLRIFRCEKRIIEDQNHSICSFYLVPEDGEPLPPFLPGQFLTLSLELPSAKGDTENITRCYSLSDAPNPEHYRLSIKRALPPMGTHLPPGRASTFFHDQITTGSLLKVRAPAGHFHIDPSDAPIILIGGGIGITPMLSMLNWSLAHQPNREIWLFYGVRHSQELMMKTHLETLAAKHPSFHLYFCFSSPLPEEKIGTDYQHHGCIDVPLLRTQLPLKPYHFYICGPTPMMESLVPTLGDWGVPDARIHYEAFGPASIQRHTSTSTILQSHITDSNILIHFAKSDKQTVWQPGMSNLLEFAEANGISVDSGCRAGSCGSCQITIQAGEVTYRQAPDYDPEPGTCLLCVCTPKTSVTLEI